jgi:hypothetical protein
MPDGSDESLSDALDLRLGEGCVVALNGALLTYS